MNHDDLRLIWDSIQSTVPTDIRVESITIARKSATYKTDKLTGETTQYYSDRLEVSGRLSLRSIIPL